MKVRIYTLKNKIIMTDKIKRTFIKDFKLPIQPIEEHFNYYIETLDPYYNSIESLSLLMDMLKDAQKETNNLEEWFFNTSRKITSSIINDISKTEAYQKFIQQDMNVFAIKNKNIKSSSLYIKNNVNKVFCSIDLKKANYQALNLISNDLVLNTNNYEEIISKYTDYDYFKKSKQIRQVIFGNLNAKRQQKIQKYIMNEISCFLISEGLKEEDIISCSADEVCFELHNLTNIKEIMQNRNVLNDIDFHVDIFELNDLSNDRTLYYKKNVDNDFVEFKSIPSYYILECIKKYEKKEIDHRDKLFLFEGRVCQFNDKLF
jgi:hypothetical protein